MDLILENKYHRLLNEVILVELTKLNMLIEALNGDENKISIFNQEYLKSLNTAYLKEVNIAFNKFKKEMKYHTDNWYKYINEYDLNSDEVIEVFTELQTCFKQNLAYILDKLNTTYETFKGNIYNKKQG